MPVHNEAETIERTLNEWFEIRHHISHDISFILSEDGSGDETVNIINQLSEKYNINLITSKLRKGYSRAVVDAIKSAKDGIICCVDSDGQCDPKDLIKFLKLLETNPTKIISGIRKPRNDSVLRLIMSKAFGLIYFVIFGIKMQDVSCPFVVGKSSSFEFVSDKIFLDQGFWWEFHARRKAANVQVLEISVNHRKRLKGNSRVYSIRSITRIVLKHLKGLIELKNELN